MKELWQQADRYDKDAQRCPKCGSSNVAAADPEHIRDRGDGEAMTCQACSHNFSLPEKKK